MTLGSTVRWRPPTAQFRPLSGKEIVWLNFRFGHDAEGRE
jgi:hypothetical protein